MEIDLEKQRKIRNGRYVFEDYLESIEKTKIIGFVCMFLGIVYLFSTLLINGSSLSHSILSLLIGICILLAPKLFSFEQNSIVILITITYLFSIIVEYFLFGLPDRLVPGLGEFGNNKVINIITMINDISPLVYFGLKLIISLLFFKVIYFSRKVKELPNDIKNLLGIKYY